MSQKVKKREFPTAYTVIIIVLLLVQMLTFFIPSGKYSTLSYDENTQTFMVIDANEQQVPEPATQATLDKYGITIQLDKFTDGTIYKPVAIPNSYQEIEKEKRGLTGTIRQFLESQINGIIDSIDIIVFILILGGVIGIVNATGAMDAGMMRLAEKMNGKQKWLIVIITTLVALGGTTFGLAEETVAFYPILVPIFLLAGYDTITAVATIYLGSAVGSMISTTNPFSTVIASNSAGINFSEGMGLRVVMWVLCVGVSILYTIRYAEKVRKNPEKSIIADQMASQKEMFLKSHEDGSSVEFDFRKKLTLIIFALGFVIMIYGVQQLGWYFTEISMVFLALVYILIFVVGLSEKEYVSSFVAGSGDLLGVALTVGVARSVSIVMETSFVSDTVMYKFSQLISGMNSVLFICVLYFVYIILGFFIQSSSGLAVLSMPIMAPLADVVGIDRGMIVNAYNWGQGIIGLIAPTGLILVSLSLVQVGFDKWLKFVTKLLVILIIMSLIALSIGVLI
ncbi:YfcC family protein [Vagococcus zengguangii]|uniref:YfcC family protein n=1 Tax=Vagococcus zengguangii TaxID=2571750 RepID=UPI001107B4F5|nr:YfcC family protein [Vagococcus zengguangii]TLG81343.1 YfcC family protein [Vagococcus zengguangii]